jgi:hypothetical protein
VQRVIIDGEKAMKYVDEKDIVQSDDINKGYVLEPMMNCTKSILKSEVDLTKECLLWHGGNWGVLYWILKYGFSLEKGREGAALGKGIFILIFIFYFYFLFINSNTFRILLH